MAFIAIFAVVKLFPLSLEQLGQAATYAIFSLVNLLSSCLVSSRLFTSHFILVSFSVLVSVLVSILVLVSVLVSVSSNPNP